MLSRRSPLSGTQLLPWQLASGLMKQLLLTKTWSFKCQHLVVAREHPFRTDLAQVAAGAAADDRRHWLGIMYDEVLIFHLSCAPHIFSRN